MSGRIRVAAGVVMLLAIALVGWRLGFFRGEVPVLEPSGAQAPEQEASKPVPPDFSPDTTSSGTSAEERTAVVDVVGAQAILEEDAAAATPAPFGSVLLRVRWHDGTAAEDVWVRAVPWDAAHPAWAARLAPTGVGGEVRFSGLPAGSVSLEPLRGGGLDVELAPGEELEAELSLPRGYDLVGSVVDLEGRPVEGADIWLSVENDFDEGAIVTCSDMNGEFRLRSISSSCHLGARSKRHAASLLKGLRDHPEGAEVPVRLVLRGDSGAVEGRVSDPAGEPVEGAIVLVGVADGRWVLDDVDEGWVPPPFEARTGEDGLFALDGLEAASSVVVQVRAPGFAIWKGAVDIAPGLMARVEAVLAPGVRVEGVVRDAAGEPMGRATVASGPWGRMGFHTKTGRDGAYVLEDLSPGEIELLVDAAWRGRARATLYGLAGETLRWDAVLSIGGELRGRVLDERGAPLLGWDVQVRSLSRAEDFHTTVDSTDASGAFVLRGLADGDHELEVRAPGSVDFPALVRRPVRPDEVLELYVPDARLPSVRLRGRVVQTDGAPANAVVLIPGLGFFGPSPQEATEADGSFELGPYPPGEWSLTVEAPDGVEHRRGPRRLEAGETWELDTIRLGEPGSLAVRLTWAEGAPAEPPSIMLEYGGMPAAETWLEPEAGLARIEGLVPGEYALCVSGEGLAAARHPFEVHEAGETRLDVRLEPGALRTLRVRERRVSSEGMLIARVLDAGGRCLALLGSDREPGGQWELQLWLGKGTYVVELSTLDGRGKLEAPLSVSDLSPIAEPVDLQF